MSYNYNNPMNRVCDYTDALKFLGDSIVEGTEYPNLAAIKAKYDSTSEKHGKAYRYTLTAKILPDVSVSGFYGTRYARNGKRKWTPEEEQFLVRAVCSSVDPCAFRSGYTMARVLANVGKIMGRTFGACQLKASNLGITRETSQYATITTKCGRVLSTKTGLPVEETKPKRVSIKTKAKKTEHQKVCQAKVSST